MIGFISILLYFNTRFRNLSLMFIMYIYRVHVIININITIYNNK